MLTFKEQRTLLGFTQESLAANLGCKVKSVSNWERGKFKPGPGLAKKLRSLGFNAQAILYPMGKK